MLARQHAILAVCLSLQGVPIWEFDNSKFMNPAFMLNLRITQGLLFIIEAIHQKEQNASPGGRILVLTPPMALE